MRDRELKIFLDAMPTMVSKRDTSTNMSPSIINLELPFRYPLKATGDFRDGVATVGTWAMAEYEIEKDGLREKFQHPAFIVVYYDAVSSKRGYSAVRGNEITVDAPRGMKEPVEKKFIITTPLEFDFIRTWVTPLAVKAFVEGKTLDPLEVYKRVEDYFLTYVDFAPDPRRYNLMAILTIATHFYRLFPAFPRVHVRGPQESGKERASRCFAYLSFLGIFEVNPTEAVMFRLAESQATQAIDEAERYYQTGPGASDVAPQRTLINTGYQEGAKVLRVLDGEFGKKQIQAFDAYSPMSLTSIRDLGRVTRSRFIDVLMRRTTNPLFSNRAPSEKSAGDIRDDLYMLRLLYADKVTETRDKLTNEEFGIKNRSWELFKPLLTVAKALGLPHDDLISFIKDWEGRRRKEEMSEEDVKLLKKLAELTKDKPDDEILMFTNAELLNAMLSDDASDDERKKKSQRIGYIARNFGFEKTDVGNKTTYKVPKKEIKDLWASYGSGEEDKSGGLGGLEGLMGKEGGSDATPQVTLDGVQKETPEPPHKPHKASESGGFSDLKRRLFDTFGVTPFKPSQLADHFSTNELPKVSVLMEEMLERGELMIIPLDSGAQAFQLVVEK